MEKRKGPTQSFNCKGCEYLGLNYIANKHKICTETQPYKLSDSEYVICNFICDGVCQFKRK